MIPSSGSDSGNALLYIANDGGIYRALDGFHGRVSGSCSGINQFDDLNQTPGSMAQLVSFSQHPSDPNTMLAGAQDNGSPATNQATTNFKLDECSRSRWRVQRHRSDHEFDLPCIES